MVEVVLTDAFCKMLFLIFAGLSHAVFKGVMKKGYKVPTPIQRKVKKLAFVLYAQLLIVLNII